MIETYIWFIGSLVGLILSLIAIVFYAGDLISIKDRSFPVREILARGLVRTELYRLAYFVFNILAGLVYVLSPHDLWAVRWLLVLGPYMFIAVITGNLIDRSRVDRIDEDGKDV